MKQSISQRKKTEPYALGWDEAEREAFVNKKGRHHMYFKRHMKKYQTRVNRNRRKKINVESYLKED